MRGHQSNVSAGRHRIDCVENQVGENLADLRAVPRDQRNLRQLAPHFDLNTLRTASSAPFRGREGNGCSHQFVQVQGNTNLVIFCRPLELAEPPDYVRRILSAIDDVMKVSQFPRRAVLLDPGQEQLAVTEHHRQSVVEVVRNATGHHPERSKPLLFDDLLLGGSQLFQGFLQLRGPVSHLLLHFDLKKPVFQQVPDPQHHL
ncbi:MAG TPA: hypothetical protein VF593_01770 [Chthoniobacteraceae bacterium]